MSGDQGGWNEHAKMVLSELRRLNDRLETLETQIENKLDKTLDTFKDDHKELEREVNELRIGIAVIKREIALKTMGIAVVVSGIMTIAGFIVQAIFS